MDSKEPFSTFSPHPPSRNIKKSAIVNSAISRVYTRHLTLVNESAAHIEFSNSDSPIRGIYYVDSSTSCNDDDDTSTEASSGCVLSSDNDEDDENDDEGESQQRHDIAEKPELRRSSAHSSSSSRKPASWRPGKRLAGHSREARIFKASDVEFSLHEIYGDGNCLFRAISYILWGTESRHRYLRTLVVNHIGSTWREIKPFVQAEWSIASLREYMGFMDTDGTFASELECVIATKLNRLNLAIYRRADAAGNLRRILYSQYNRRAPTANLLFSGRNEFGHYDVLLPVQ